MGGKTIIFTGLLLICANCLYSQLHQETSNLRIGFNYGMGSENWFPFNSQSYTYENRFYKGILNYGFTETRRWSLEANFELGWYRVKYNSENQVRSQSANKSLIDTEPGLQKKLNEYVLNVGLLSRYKVSRHFGFYALGSLGPMISNCGTDRLAHGFAFSDIFALGLRYSITVWAFDLRYSYRHVSNAGLELPNKGHNSTNLELGCLIQL